MASPSDDNWGRQAEADDADIQKFLSNMEDNPMANTAIEIEDIDQSGKADDAMDYADISDDDDLPDEEPATALNGTNTDDDDDDDPFGLGLEDGPDMDDLFGDNNYNAEDGQMKVDHLDGSTTLVSQDVLPALTDDGAMSTQADALEDSAGALKSDDSLFAAGPPTPDNDQTVVDNTGIVPDSSFGNPPPGVPSQVDSPSLSHQMDLALPANQDPDIPSCPTNPRELVLQKWPTFNPTAVLEWNKLLPPKLSEVTLKAPTKKMKPLITSKLTLEIAPDQEKMFRIPGHSRRKFDIEQSNFINLGLSRLDDDVMAENEIKLDNDDDDDDDEGLVGGFSLQDIATVCFDFGANIEAAEKTLEAAQTKTDPVDDLKNMADADGEDDEDDDWNRMFMDAPSEEPSKKKARVIDTSLPKIHQYDSPNFDYFEKHTKRLGKRVFVDFSDPHLHLEEVSPEVLAKRRKLDASHHQKTTGHLGRLTLSRFNMSNDVAYELLKENHKHKVRATLGNINVEHSLPALKLAWPYYRVKLDETPDRYHRPQFRLRGAANSEAEFFKRGHVKKKYTKGKVQEVFKATKDLSLGDNGTAVLFEYCERIPTVLSKFGMANRVINYYRKVDANEEHTPEKLDIGETHVLLPEDRSPFSIFGTVGPGEMVPTFHNQMYRAPLFKHKVRNGDFLMVRSTTIHGGSRWYLRNIDHIYVVGQTFPSVEVPGPHSRKVTNASKNRIKMISYRLMRKDPGNLVNLSDVTKHIADSTDAQNRQKLKEFLSYAKSEKGQWKLREGEILMEEERIRAMIKPEDTCLIDGMALGLKMLEDAGFDPKNTILDDDESGGDEDEDGFFAHKFDPAKSSHHLAISC